MPFILISPVLASNTLTSGLLTADALFFYSIGLCAYAGTKILQSCFFSLKDTVTPTKIAFLALLMNIILNAVLMFPLKIGGLALATSISGITTFFFLFFILKAKLSGFGERKIFTAFLRMLAAAVCMATVCFLVNLALNLGWALFCGAISYIVFCFLFGVTELQELMHWLLHKNSRQSLWNTHRN